MGKQLFGCSQAPWIATPQRSAAMSRSIFFVTCTGILSTASAFNFLSRPGLQVDPFVSTMLDKACNTTIQTLFDAAPKSSKLAKLRDAPDTAATTSSLCQTVKGFFIEKHEDVTEAIQEMLMSTTLKSVDPSTLPKEAKRPFLMIMT